MIEKTSPKLDGDIVIVTGGSGLLGSQFCEAIKEINGTPIVLDIKPKNKHNENSIYCDITNETEVKLACLEIRKRPQRIYGLINCAALDPKFDNQESELPKNTIVNYDLNEWERELKVGLTGAIICTKIFGKEMIKHTRGSIINISSLLGIVSPNQNMYKDMGKVKPLGYTIIKHAIIGLTKHTACEWAEFGIRCNALAPGGVFTNHPEEFVEKLTNYIPLNI